MCGYHVSEASPQRFVFRVRGNPAYGSECVKMQFHVQCQEPETAMFTVGFRVFDGCSPIFICVTYLDNINDTVDTLLSTTVVLFALMGVIGGYHAARFTKVFASGEGVSARTIALAVALGVLLPMLNLSAAIK